jgi:hypothetical protein
MDAMTLMLILHAFIIVLVLADIAWTLLTRGNIGSLIVLLQEILAVFGSQQPPNQPPKPPQVP